MGRSAEGTHFWTGRPCSSSGIRSDTETNTQTYKEFSVWWLFTNSTRRDLFLNSSGDPNVSRDTKYVRVNFREVSINLEYFTYRKHHLASTRRRNTLYTQCVHSKMLAYRLENNLALNFKGKTVK